MGTTPWWRDAVGYEVYLRSFADGNGDGVGDLIGLADRLDHLCDLGIDIVWITPFYPSPGHDHGYDVADYVGVADECGGMEALQRVVDGSHARGMRVIVDIVPNHSSHEHPWFIASVTDPEGPYGDYYVWRDGEQDTPPNNWMSHFGGPAWTWEPTRQQWYLHLFLPEQPDLNWANTAVRDEFDQVLRTWFERGVDGVRIDVAHSMLVDEEFRSNPEPDVPLDWSDPREVFHQIDHVHDLDQPGNVEIYRRWNPIAAEHDALLLGEVYLLSGPKVSRYIEDGLLHRAFFFPSVHTVWDPAEIRAVLQAGHEAGRGRFSWVMSSHDDPRAATRFGGGAVGTRRQLAYLALLLAMPGTPFLYQGDELGLSNGQRPAGVAVDPIAVRNPAAAGRDGSRTPIPWDDGPNLGFTPATPWMPVGTNHTAADTVAAQTGDSGSPLERTRTLLHTRRTLTTMLDTDVVTWLTTPTDVIALRRGDVVAACNLGTEQATVTLPGAGRLVAASADGTHVEGTSLSLPTDVTAWVRLDT